MLIRGDAALAEFRAGLTGPRGIAVLGEHDGGLLLESQVGVGKSTFLDAVTEEAIASGRYDLVLVLSPTKRLIAERLPVQSPPPGVRVEVLRPRPAGSCGPERDARWRAYEAAELGALGRADLCGRCPLLGTCFWPAQYGPNLRGTQIIYATQAHLEQSSGFISRVASWAGAERPLTLFDESDFIAKNRDVVVGDDTLKRFGAVLDAAAGRCDDAEWQHEAWQSRVEMLRAATTADLQDPAWRMPPIRPEWAAEVQRVGREIDPAGFRFPAYRLAEFAASPIETRRKGEDGTLEFATRPLVGDCIVFSGTTDLQFARHRLGRDLASPFAGYRFEHPGTTWANIASPIGTRSYFPRHAPQVLDFFAALVARRTAEGRRALLVAKKCFVGLCTAGLAPRLAELGADLRLVAEDWTEEVLADPRTVPVISYGMIGTNLFEHFDCAYCLTGYYVDEAVVDGCLQDAVRADLRIPIRIETVGSPRRRRAGVADPAHGDYDVARLAQAALELKEHGVVVQAAGRVRPFTRPREVITFQMGQLPGVRYDAEFRTLGEARRHFDVAPGGARRKQDRKARAAELRAAGKTQAETAMLLGLSERTIRTYETEDRQETISDY